MSTTFGVLGAGRTGQVHARAIAGRREATRAACAAYIAVFASALEKAPARHPAH